jgi:hypothetical protein
MLRIFFALSGHFVVISWSLWSFRGHFVVIVVIVVISWSFRGHLFFSQSPFSAQKGAKKWSKKAKSGEEKRASTLEISEKNEFPENGK